MACGITICFIVLCGVALVNGALTLDGAKCGQKTCKLTEYCSNFDKTCQPCEAICNKLHNNYEPALCMSDCQDYLHDIRYARKDGGGDDDIRATVEHLSRIVSVTLALVCFLLIVLCILLCFQLYRWKVKKNITLDTIKRKFSKKSSPDSNVPKTNINANQESKKPDLRLDMPSTISISDHSPVTVTTSISRRPAEDTTLDYAYDNPAMTKTNNSSF